MTRSKKKKCSTSAAPQSTLDMDFCNVRGLHENINAVHHHLETAKPTLLFLTETQISSQANTSYLLYPGFIHKFVLEFILEHKFVRRAGVCLYVREEEKDLSILWVRIDQNDYTGIYAVFYLLTMVDIHCYADDSTGDAFYTGRANIPLSVVEANREQLVSEIESTLIRVSDWGPLNLVQFNPTKTQTCALTAKIISFAIAPLFQNMSITISKSIGILGIDISSRVEFHSHLEEKVKLASKKLGVLTRAKRYFTADQRLL